jgi:hypothetical protein
MKVSLTFIKLFQKCESVGFLTQLPRVLSFMYLFLKRSCHMPSSFNKLNSHLLNKHLFCMSKFCIPKPPCIFGWHKIFHLANLYLRLCWLFCQKNLDLKQSIFSNTPLGSSKKDIINIGKLESTEFIKTNRPPTENILPFHPLNLFSILFSIICRYLLLCIPK